MIDGKAVRQKLIGSDDERAVSPVIGVILMVAITVILAAVIAAFVLDMGPGNQTISADAQIGDESNGNITVELTAGGGDVDGIAFVSSSGDIAVDDEGLDSTGASGTYNDSTSMGADIEGSLTDTEEYTIYAYQGNVEQSGSIDDADASVEVGTVTYEIP